MSEYSSNYIEGVRKIAVLRANALGDFIFSLPALYALRAAYPDAEIVFLGQRWHHGFLSARPSPVDRVVAIPPSRGVNDGDGPEDTAALEAFFAAMQRECFDIALQVHGGGRNSNPFVQRLGARLTVGLKAADAPPLDRWIPYIYFQQEILRYLEVVSLIGARPVGLEPHVSVTKEDLAEAEAVVPQNRRPLVALHAGAGDGRRRWPLEKFAKVGDALARAGAHVVINGTPPERELVEGLTANMKAAAQSLCGQLSLGGLAGLLSRCRLMVSNDSGPLHLAGAVGTPAVGIYWCGNLMNCGHLNRARHRPFASWRLDCPLCGRNTIRDNCEHHVSFVDDVGVEEVVTAALELLHCPPAPSVL